MAEFSIDAAYHQILQERKTEIIATGGLGANQRVNPRFRVKTDDLWISSVPDFTLLDMSITGLAIRSNYPLEVDQVIEVSLGSSLSATAIVVDCKLVGSADEWTDAEFRISCRYAEDLRGKELLVKAIHPNA